MALRDRLVFLRLWLRHPLRIAAWCPSTVSMSRSIARHVDRATDLPVLELGGGTGAITAALLEHGVPARRLYVIERERVLCAVLRRRFPGVTVLEGEAANLGAMLDAQGIARLSAVVSTLPIIWFTREEQHAIVDQAFARLMPGGPFVQSTNQPSSPIRKRPGLKGRKVGFIWRSLPPVFVWRYERPASAH